MLRSSPARSPSFCVRGLFASALVLFALARPARAQTADGGGLGITVTSPASLAHQLPGGGDFTRSSSLTPSGINFEDCEKDVSLVFPLVVSGTSAESTGMELYAFAGSGCDAGGAAVQAGVAGSTCWPLVAGAIGYTVGGSVEVKIRARQILAQATLTTKAAYSAVATTDDSMCHTQPTSAPLQVVVYFIFGTTPGLATIGGSGNVTVNADLAAAAPPTTVSVGIGDTLLITDWSPVADADIVGFNVYYLPIAAPDAGVVAVCGDAGAGGDAAVCANESTIDTSGAAADSGIPYAPSGVECASPFPAGAVSSGTGGSSEVVTESDGGTGTISTTGTIAALAMQPREVAKGAYPFVEAAGATATSATLGGLTNDVEYVVAVAATDAYGNVGELSSYRGGGGSDGTCQWPQPVTDFFTSYRDASGQAGGGFCSASADDSGAGGGTALLVGAAAIFALRRSRRSRRSRGGGGADLTGRI